MRTRLIALVAVSMVVLGSAQVALAAIPTTITARYDTEVQHFKGRVKSDDAECVGGRTVKLFKKTSDGPQLQGKDTTGTLGRWNIELMSAHGKYFAVTPRAESMHGVCERAVSPIVDVM